jgi:NAD(P)H-flavin reductase
VSDVPLPTFSPLAPARLAARRGVALDQIEIELAVSPALRAAHARPGQFVKVSVTDEVGARHEGIFAMANAPGEPVGAGVVGAPSLRFLLRTNNPEGGEAAARLATLPLGDTLLVSEPAGEGFDLARAAGKRLCFVATGTAIAPVRAGLEAALTGASRPRAISLDFGLRSPAHLPIEAELARWSAAGVETHLHYSVPREDGTVSGTRAHDALLARLEATGTAHEAFVVAVGQPEMVKELRARLVALGGRAEDVVSNY